MKDHRRDHTVAIPQSTLEELAESQRKLSKRDTTLVGGAIVSDDPRTPETSSSILGRAPREPIRRDELQTVLAEHLKLFPEACQEAFLRSFCARSYVGAVNMLDEAVKLQPKNLSMAQAASAIRHFAITRLESDLGGLHAKVRAIGVLHTSDLPRPLADMLLHADGNTSIETLLRRTPGNRLQALGLLADLARDDQIELLLSSPQRNVSLRLPPMAAGASARIDSAPKGGSPRESGERKRVERPRVDSPALPVLAAPAPPVPAALPLPDDLVGPEDESAKERRLVTWSSSPASAPVPGPFAVVSREPAELAPAVLPSTPSPPDPPSWNASPELVSRARQSSSAPTPVVAELRGHHVGRDAVTSRRWFIPAVLVAAVAVVGGLIMALGGESHTVPPPHPASTVARPAATEPAPTLLPPVPVQRATTEANVAAITDGIASTMIFKIEVEPKYARVTLDGVLLTKAPIRAVIPKDGKEHEVRIESAGFHSKKMRFVADADVSMIVALDRAAVSPPRASSTPR